MRDEMIENIRRLSDLLEAETKRLQSANSERDRWLNEAQRLEKECSELRSQIIAAQPKQPSSDNELQSKIAELMDENAKLAGDLLKLESNNTDDEIRQMEQHFAKEQAIWRKEKQSLETRIEELRRETNNVLVNGLNG
jgi:predicted  nucleic acid-binding Zn-ribbon protein